MTHGSCVFLGSAVPTEETRKIPWLNDKRNTCCVQVALVLIELDASTRQCVWSYPSIDNGTEQQLVARAAQLDDRTNVYFIAKHKQAWQYYLAMPGPTEGPAKVVTFCLLSAHFAPEKFEALLRVLAHQYLVAGSNPLVLLASFLEVFTQRQVGAGPTLRWRAADFDAKAPLLGGSLSEVWPLGLYARSQARYAR